MLFDLHGKTFNRMPFFVEFDEIREVIYNRMDYYSNERYQWNLAKFSPNEYYEYLTSGIYPLPVRPPDVSDGDANVSTSHE